MDIMSKKERSKRMSLIKSKWTRPERLVHNFLKGNKIRHEMHPKIVGSPDIILKDKKIAIFIHGCFWHGCKKCYRKPMNNKHSWKDTT
jgi:DNA mismatch endonuclease (patch repair protein)